MTADTRRDRHRMRQRGAGARELENVKFDFDFNLFSPAKLSSRDQSLSLAQLHQPASCDNVVRKPPDPAKTASAEPRKIVAQDDNYQTHAAKRPKRSIAGPKTAHFKQMRKKQQANDYIQLAADAQENTSAETRQRLFSSSPSQPQIPAKLQTLQVGTRQPFVELINEAQPSRKRKQRASNNANNAAESKGFLGTKPDQSKPRTSNSRTTRIRAMYPQRGYVPATSDLTNGNEEINNNSLQSSIKNDGLDATNARLSRFTNTGQRQVTASGKGSRSKPVEPFISLPTASLKESTLEHETRLETDAKAVLPAPTDSKSTLLEQQNLSNDMNQSAIPMVPKITKSKRLRKSRPVSRRRDDWAKQDWFQASVPVSLQQQGNTKVGKVDFRF